MNHSKIFLGATTCILAAAALAAKKTNFTKMHKAYTSTHNPEHFCTRYYDQIGYTVGTSAILGYTNVLGLSDKKCTDAVHLSE